jgi:hypothetical protein
MQNRETIKAAIERNVRAVTARPQVAANWDATD